MKYIVWIIENRGGIWEENGEGPLTLNTAERIARETPGCHAVKVLPVGREPNAETRQELADIRREQQRDQAAEQNQEERQ